MTRARAGRRRGTYYASVVGALLLINARSGNASPGPAELAEAAREQGIDARVLAPAQDVERIARDADTTVLGIAGGDGSLAAVAGVAIERNLPFVCIPFGTRNHFARDLGLDRGDPIAALDAFAGDERRIDVGRVGDRVFLNNVSLGDYARLVHRRERHRRRRAALARLRALAIILRERGRPPLFRIDGTPVRARIVLVANNAYALDLFNIGERERLDDGLLHLYITHGLRRSNWEERCAPSFTVEAARHRVRAAIDGEPALLETPLELSIEPAALRVLVPRDVAAQ